MDNATPDPLPELVPAPTPQPEPDPSPAPQQPAPGAQNLHAFQTTGPNAGSEFDDGDVSADPTPRIVGNGIPGGTIHVYQLVGEDSYFILGQATVDEEGNWSFQVPKLQDGEHTLVFTQSTPDAPEADSGWTLEFRVDTVAPEAYVAITGISDAQGDVTDFTSVDGHITLKGTVDQLAADERVQVSVDGGHTWADAAMDGADAWSYADPRSLEEGGYDYQVRVIDLAGNAGPVASQEVSVVLGAEAGAEPEASGAMLFEATALAIDLSALKPAAAAARSASLAEAADAAADAAADVQSSSPETPHAALQPALLVQPSAHDSLAEDVLRLAAAL